MVLSHSEQTGEKHVLSSCSLGEHHSVCTANEANVVWKKNTVYSHVIRHGNTGISKRGGKTGTNYSCTGNLFLGVYHFWCSWTLTLQFLLMRLVSSLFFSYYTVTGNFEQSRPIKNNHPQLIIYSEQNILFKDTRKILYQNRPKWTQTA